MTFELITLARAAYLRAAGHDWPSIAEKLGQPGKEFELISNAPAWQRLTRLARRLVAQESEAEARLERRRALRSPDEAEASAAADEAYSLHAKRRSANKPTAAPTERDRLARAYLDCLNTMTAEEFVTIEQCVEKPHQPEVHRSESSAG